MSLKWIGAILIVAGCGGFGCSIAGSYRAQERALRQLVRALDYMSSELQYRMTALPELCRAAAQESRGCIHDLLVALAEELQRQISPDAASCMTAALSKTTALPTLARKNLEQLGQSLGRFDLQGQLRGLDAVRQSCRSDLEALAQNREVRLRSYQTLGLCAGAALVVLLV